MSKTEDELARLEATALRLIESGNPGRAAKGRAVRGVLIPITKWLASEHVVGGNPRAALEGFCDSIARGLVMASGTAAPDGQDLMVGVYEMLGRICASAHNFADFHAEKMERDGP